VIAIAPPENRATCGKRSSTAEFDNCWFDAERCSEGLAALKNYQRAYDDERDTYSERPVHNWASNGSDAFRQFAQGWKLDTPVNQERMKPRYSARPGGWMS
jgi:phage terminase large subunit